MLGWLYHLIVPLLLTINANVVTSPVAAANGGNMLSGLMRSLRAAIVNKTINVVRNSEADEAVTVAVNVSTTIRDKLNLKYNS